MPKSSGTSVHFVLFLVFITLLSENSVVFGSTESETIAKRSDPLNKFKQYGGDFDISNKHYWASAAFTGIHGYAVAGLWLVSGISFGSFILLKKSCCTTSSVADHSNSSYKIVIWLIVLFTIFAITASSVAIAASQTSLQRTKKLEETIFGAGEDACQTIGKVKTTLIHLQNFLCQYDSKTCHQLNLITHRLRKESTEIQSFVDKTRHSCDHAIQTLYVVNLLVASFNLLLLFSGLVLLTLHCRPGILVFIFSCWILATLSWILTGIDFFFNTFIEDTCAILKSFKENPQSNSLAGMLPCPKLADSDKALVQIGYTVHNVIAKVNSKMSELLKVFAVTEQNDETIQEVCDPFSSAPNYTYSPENCGKNSIPVGDLPSVLSKFICFKGNVSENCPADGRLIPEAIYFIALAYSRSIQDIINIYPDLLSLVQCSSVKDAVSDIVLHQCKPIKRSAKVLWSSMLSLSIVMVILVLVWCEKAIKDRGKCFSRWSIFPSPSRS